MGNPRLRTPLLQDDVSDERLNPNPTPEERADFVVKRLEQFIRDGRTIAEGMSLSKWQEMARVEIANAVASSEIDQIDDDKVTKRLLLTIGAGLTTIGFWGALWAYDKVSYVVSAFVCGAAGLIMIGIALEWRMRKAVKNHKVKTRKKALRRCEDLTKRIKKMEQELQKELERKEKKLAKAEQQQLNTAFDELRETLASEVERRFGPNGP